MRSARCWPRCAAPIITRADEPSLRTCASAARMCCASTCPGGRARDDLVEALLASLRCRAWMPRASWDGSACWVRSAVVSNWDVSLRDVLADLGSGRAPRPHRRLGRDLERASPIPPSWRMLRRLDARRAARWWATRRRRTSPPPRPGSGRVIIDRMRAAADMTGVERIFNLDLDKVLLTLSGPSLPPFRMDSFETSGSRPGHPPLCLPGGGAGRSTSRGRPEGRPT